MFKQNRQSLQLKAKSKTCFPTASAKLRVTGKTDYTAALKFSETITMMSGKLMDYSFLLDTFKEVKICRK